MKPYFKKSSNFLRNHIYVVSVLFVFAFFYFISTKVPLAGDDWGYALNGMKNNPFVLTFEFYFTWSGRFFSELYGFLVTPHKWIWNILNAGLFALIIYSILKIAGLMKSVTASLLIIFLMFSVKDELRMETYTWLMGTTYLIPLALSLFYFSIVLKNIEKYSRIEKWMIPVLGIILFISSFMMENATVVLVFANFVLLVYIFVRDRTIPITYLSFFLISLLGLILIRVSPGASSRLLRDHSAWINLSIFEQLKFNYTNFIRFTFIEHRYLVLVFSGLSLLKLLENLIKERKNLVFTLIHSLFFIIAAFTSLTLTINSRFPNEIFNLFIDVNSYFNLIFWPLFILVVFHFIYISFKKEDQLKLFFFVLLAGISNGVMMLSPIFGYRSSLYTVYYLIVTSAIIYSSLDQKVFSKLLILPLLVLCFSTSKQLLYKYNLVQSVHNIRLSQIQYYLDNPDVKDIWLIRYPIFTIHGGDIEADDTYHLEVFKEFYGLADDTTLNFYFPEEGY